MKMYRKYVWEKRWKGKIYIFSIYLCVYVLNFFHTSFFLATYIHHFYKKHCSFHCIVFYTEKRRKMEKILLSVFFSFDYNDDFSDECESRIIFLFWEPERVERVYVLSSHTHMIMFISHPIHGCILWRYSYKI